jgi:signal transduction histidine kinase
VSRFPRSFSIPLALEAGALVFYLVRSPLLAGGPATAAFLAGAITLILATTVVAAFLDGTGWPLRLLLLQGLVLFWATTGETVLLPVRWLLHGALVAEASLLLPLWGSALAFVVIGIELILVTHVIPGMTFGTPDPVETATILTILTGLGLATHRLKYLESQLQAERDRNDNLHASVLQLTSANTEFLEQANSAGEVSAIEERHRITRDLHDVVGQTLTNIIMMMDASLHRQTEDPDEIAKLFRWVRKQAQTGLEETRRVLYELRAVRPPALRGVKALKKLIDTFAQLSRIKPRVNWGNLPWTFDPDQETAVHHLVQSSLSNAFRHGSATEVDIHFHVEEGILNIMIRDDGNGGPTSSWGIGQRGMAERLAPWGGTVTFRSEPFGYVVLATLPLKEAEDGGENSHRR